MDEYNESFKYIEEQQGSDAHPNKLMLTGTKLTFPCIRSLIVKVTFSPPSTTPESITAVDIYV